MFGKNSQLNFLHVSLSMAIFFSVAMLALSLFALIGFGEEIATLIGTIYVGYKLTFLGILCGLLYGFVDGFIAGAIFVWIYNWLNKLLN